MDALIAYLLDHPSVGLYAVLAVIVWWLRGFVSEVRENQRRLTAHEEECAIRTARVHERLDEMSRDINQVIGWMKGHQDDGR